MKRKKLGNKKFLIIFLIVVLVISLNYFGGDQIKQSFYAIITPVQSFLHRSVNSLQKTIHSWFFSKKELLQKNRELTNEKEELIYQLHEKQNLQQENQKLRKALDLELNKEFTFQGANSLEVNLEQGWLLIDKGKKQKIETGFPVITPHKELIGVIDKIYPRYARVRLIFQQDSSWQAGVKSQEQQITGVVHGNTYPALQLDLIPVQYNLQTGTQVFTDETQQYPGGLLLGKISAINKQNVESFQQATLEPNININDLSLVFILTSF